VDLDEPRAVDLGHAHPVGTIRYEGNDPIADWSPVWGGFPAGRLREIGWREPRAQRQGARSPPSTPVASVNQGRGHNGSFKRVTAEAMRHRDYSVAAIDGHG
jgi:hypothetical protein